MDEILVKIRELLKEKKISYEDLSKMSNIPLSTIKKVLSGNTPNPRIDTINAILTALDLNDKKEEQPKHVTYKRFMAALEKEHIYEADINKLNDEQLELISNIMKNFLNTKD